MQPRASQGAIFSLAGRRHSLEAVSALAPWNYLASWSFPPATDPAEIVRTLSRWTHGVNRDALGHRYHIRGRGFFRALTCGPTPSGRVGILMLCQIPRRGIGAALQETPPRTIAVDRPVADLIPEHFRSTDWILDGDPLSQRQK